MKKLNKVASLFAGAALAASMSGAFAQTVDNWTSGYGETWKNGTNEYCWRDASWTPATAKADCDGALKEMAEVINDDGAFMLLPPVFELIAVKS